MPTELRAIERTLSGIERSLDRIEKNLRPVRGGGMDRAAEGLVRSTTQSGTLEEQVPLEIDWTPAAIKTEASFIRRADGKVTIVIEVVGEDADILMASIPDTPVEYLQLIAVAK
jgi:hypothetical protein